MTVVLEVWGLNWQLRPASKHEQAASFGVGGNLVEPTKLAFVPGHAGYVAAGALLCVGVVTNVRLPYLAFKLS